MIEGLKVEDLQYHSDDRGWLVELVHGCDLPEHELYNVPPEPGSQHGVSIRAPRFGQVYAVGDPAAGTIRAFHKHAVLWDYFTIINGSAKFVFVDDRDGVIEIPAPGQMVIKYPVSMQVEILSVRRPARITVPPGIFHGWMSLEPNTILISTASEVYNREHPDEVRIPFDSFGTKIWAVNPR